MPIDKVWVVAETADGKPTTITSELLTKARSLGATVEAVAWGADTAGCAAELGTFGATTVYDVGDLGGALPGAPGPTSHPATKLGSRMRGQPAQAGRPRRGPGRDSRKEPRPDRNRRKRAAPVSGHRNASHLAGHQGDPVMPVRRQVQSVRGPQSPVGEHPHRPQVDQQAVVLAGDRPDMHVEHRGAAPDQPDHRESNRVEPGERHDRAACAGQGGDGRLKLRGQRVRIGARPQQVVPACRDADQVGTHRSRRRDLLVDDLAQQLAADREISVPKARTVLC